MNECLNWAALSDKSAVGEVLTAEERLFLRSHPNGCPVCASEATLWDSLERVLEEPERLTARSARLASVGSPGWLGRIVSKRFPKRRTLLATVAIVAAAAAASAALWSRPGDVERRAPSIARNRPVSLASAGGAAGVQLALSAGDTLVDQRGAVAGERLGVGTVVTVGSGQACLLVPPGVSVCLDSNTRISIETLDADKRRFRLHAGHAVAHLYPQPVGSTFGFETAAGSVVAKGTVFSLKADGSSVALRVQEGVVVNSKGNETSAYKAPSLALLSPERGILQVPNESASDSRLVELAKYFGDQTRGTLVVNAAAGSNVAVGDFPLGVTPVSALVQPGDYRMEVSRSGFAPIVERLTVEAGARVVRNYEATAELTPTSDNGTPKVPRGVSPSTAAELLERARELRSGGHYKDANGAYQRLLREYPASAEARVALVSLGELQLSQLGDAGAALRSFEAYLRGGGALRQEASYGRIRALRRLGRLDDARIAADAFVSAYPKSVQATALRKELP